jgi:hypothetical protein
MQLAAARSWLARTFVVVVTLTTVTPLPVFGQTQELWYGVHLGELNLGTLHYVYEGSSGGAATIVAHATMQAVPNGIESDLRLEFRLDPDGVWRLHWWAVFAN